MRTMWDRSLEIGTPRDEELTIHGSRRYGSLENAERINQISRHPLLKLEPWKRKTTCAFTSWRVGDDHILGSVEPFIACVEQCLLTGQRDCTFSPLFGGGFEHTNF
jgi:hypothetical protein